MSFTIVMFKNIIRIFLVAILTYLLGYTLSNHENSELEKETNNSTKELRVETTANDPSIID